MRVSSIATFAFGLFLGLGACDSSDTSPSDEVDTVADTGADTLVGTDTSVSEDSGPTEVEEDAATTDTTATDSGTDVTAPSGTEVDSKKAAYHVWFDGPNRARAGIEIKYTVTVLDLSNAPVTGLALAPTYIHAEMGHGGPKNPTSTELGAGVYEITNLVASMAGTWEVKVALPNADSARIAVTVTP
jgi:hypothetical protein